MALSALDGLPRCQWGVWTDPLYLAYHDEEWGVPVHDDRRMFEFLILEGAQAGLSWSTILHRREGYRAAFAGFDVDAIARFGPADVERSMADPGIVRNRAKVASVITNARATLRLRDEGLGLAEHLWTFVGGQPRVTRWQAAGQTPSATPESDAMSRDLKRRGFAFVGPTVCYSIMQATGMVNDHLMTCFRWRDLGGS